MFSLCAKSNKPNTKMSQNYHTTTNTDAQILTHNNNNTNNHTNNNHILLHILSWLIRNTKTRVLCLCVSSFLTTFHFWSIQSKIINNNKITTPIDLLFNHTHIHTHIRTLQLTSRIRIRIRTRSRSQDMLGPEEAYEGLYGQGPPSVHSSHGGRAFHQQGMYARFTL